MIATEKWLKFSLLNLCIVATLGTLMRYKIGFEFPFLEQKFIQHAHSHFAFSAWITQTLFVFLIRFLSSKKDDLNSRPYNFILFGNAFTSYGMLISFAVSGYSPISIALSQINILIFYFFAWKFLTDSKPLKSLPAVLWFRAAILFGVLSSLGTYSLAYMMSTHQVMQKVYLASVYFYLHFQYNGWFFFGCAGVLIAYLSERSPGILFNKNIFRLFAYSCIPAYLLSVLWLKLPIWVYLLVVVAALMQSYAWIRLFAYLRKTFATIRIAPFGKFIFILIAAAVFIKYLLQLGSVIPEVSHLAFGFRPIVIAYLHLVLLAIISLFLLNFMSSIVFENQTKKTRLFLLLFTTGVFLNELILAVQGIASFSYTLVPFVNELLFAVSVWMLLSILIFLVLQLRRPNET